MGEVIKAYKGFNKDMTCRDFRYEELLELDFNIPMDRKKEEILKKYCAEHDGKYYATDERRCVVKE